MKLFGIKFALDIDTTEAREAWETRKAELEARSIEREALAEIRAEERAEKVSAERARLALEAEKRKKAVEYRKEMIKTSRAAFTKHENNEG